MLLHAARQGLNTLRLGPLTNRPAHPQTADPRRSDTPPSAELFAVAHPASIAHEGRADSWQGLVRAVAAYCLDVAATALAEEGERDRAAAILGATERTRERLGMALDDDEKAMRDRAMAAIQPVLDGAELERALARGSDLDLARALEVALETSEAVGGMTTP